MPDSAVAQSLPTDLQTGVMPDQPKPPWISPALCVLAAGVGAALHIGKLPPALPVLGEVLGVSLLQAGFLLSAMQFSGMLLGLLTGLAVQRVGAKRSMVLGLLTVAAGSALGALAEANIPTASAKSVPISQVATVKLDWEPGIVWRENGSWAITVQTDILEGLQGATISDQINAKLADLRSQATGDLKIIVAGSVEKSDVSNQSIQANFPWMIVLVFVLLMIQLRSFSRSLIVFITAPLGIIGAAATLLLLRAPMGFVATLGIIALSGMIMRNSVILIDQIEQDRKAGVPAWDAVIEAAVRRFRPIMLTAAAAILAMIPLTRNVLWGPMAVAIMGGLLVATALTLLFLPAFYAACFRIKRPESAL